eukprot:1189909-Prorocentrum_minimum.AAC.2
MLNDPPPPLGCAAQDQSYPSIRVYPHCLSRPYRGGLFNTARNCCARDDELTTMMRRAMNDKYASRVMMCVAG